MFREIIQTIGARYLVAFLNLLLIFINSKTLGREGMGIIGVIFASANIVSIFNSIFCGNTIVYFINRFNLRYVFVPAYGWAIAGSSIACTIMYYINLLPDGYEMVVFYLSVLISLFSAHSMMLLGKDCVRVFNLMFIFQGTLMFSFLLFLYYIAEYRDIRGYLFGLFSAYLVAYLYSTIRLIPFLSKRNNNHINKSFANVLKEMMIYGMWSSLDNLAEGLTTRLNYFFIQQHGGYGSVGLLDSGTRMSESVWHISNSISYIEYNRISKTINRQKQKRITLQLFKLSYCALIIVMGLLCCIPEWVYTDYLLTEEFSGIRKVIIGLSFGIVAFGSNRILSHYFIGSGSIKYSTFCSVSGLALLFVVGIFLIPAYGVFGAAITSSIAYSGMLLLSLMLFLKQTGASIIELFPSKSDWNELIKFTLSRRKD